jgi:hypothetical protein
MIQQTNCERPCVEMFRRADDDLASVGIANEKSMVESQPFAVEWTMPNTIALTPKVGNAPAR